MSERNQTETLPEFSENAEYSVEIDWRPLDRPHTIFNRTNFAEPFRPVCPYGGRMSQSSSCNRCGIVLAEETPGGVCATCRNSPVPLVLRATTDLQAKTLTAAPDAQLTGSYGPETVEIRVAPPMPPGYEFRGPLGQGGMGVVVRAYEIAGDREVALKLIRIKTDVAARKRFCVEAQSLARIKHPNVVQVFSVEVNSRDPFFTMEIVEGPTLDKVLKAGPLPIAEAVRLIVGAARGIAAVHAAGVVHRDMKPSNILLSPDGTPKVTDFGLAKRTDRSDLLTIPEAMLGTPSYMAPEQAGRKHADIGPLSDVYSLGATLYALLAGEPPFHADDPVMTAALVLTAAPRSVRELSPEIPESLEAIVGKAMAKAPAERYPSATEFAEELQRWLSGTPGPRKHRPWQTRGFRHLARRFSRHALSAVAVLIGAIGLTLFASTARTPAARSAALVARPNALVTPEELRSVLQSEKKAVLVDASGVRVTSAWAVGAGEIHPPKAKDVAFSFSTGDYAVLLLATDPGIDSYRVRAELRHDEAVGDAKPKSYARSEVGLVFGYTDSLIDPNRTIHGLETVTFSEYTPLNAPPNLVVRHNTELLQTQPLQVLYTQQRQGPVVPLAPNAPGVKRDWKTIEVDVHRTGLIVRHNEKEAASGFADIERRRKALGDQLRALPFAKHYVDRGWSPQCGMGLFAKASWLSVRNVTIESIPPIP